MAFAPKTNLTTLPLVIVISLWALSINASAREYIAMSEERKQLSIERFKNATKDGMTEEQLVASKQKHAAKAAQKAQYATAEERYNAFVRHDVVSLIQNGKYAVRVSYLKDKDFPIKYAGVDFYKEDRSEVFKAQWDPIIFEYYLGEGYAKYSPYLVASTKIVSILCLISDLSELETLLSDSRVIRVRHIGTPRQKIYEGR